MDLTSQNPSVTKDPKKNKTNEIDSNIHGSHHPNFSSALFINLKKNYEERIQSLEHQFKQTLKLVENDQILKTTKLNQSLEENRKQRIKEIVENSLSSEREILIQKLEKSNALLKTEFAEFVEQSNLEKKSLLKENQLLKLTISDLEATALNHEQLRNNLEHELNQMRLELKYSANSGPQQHISTMKNYDQEMLREGYRSSKPCIDELQKHCGLLEHIRNQQNLQIQEMTHDIEVLRREYQIIESHYQRLTEDHEMLLQNDYVLKEANQQLQREVGVLRNQNNELKNEISFKKNEISATNRDREELRNKIDALATQLSQVTETENKSLTLRLRDIKTKYKTKIRNLKEKLEELKQLNGSLVSESQSLKHTNEERKLHYEQMLSNMQNDMKRIKNEWERKYKELEITSQKISAEQKARHQSQLNQLQTEYQSLLDQKFADLQSEASIQINQSRTFDLELKTVLENKIAQMEKDYISLSKHENILSTKIMEVKLIHTKEKKEIEEKYEKEIHSRVKQLVEKSTRELEAALASMKNANRTIEGQKTVLQVKIDQLQKALDSEKQQVLQISSQLIDCKASQKDLISKLDESSANLINFKTLYETEIKKTQSLETTIERLQSKIKSLEETIRCLENTKNELQNELNNMHELEEELQKSLRHFEANEINIEKKQQQLQTMIDGLTRERDELIAKARRLEEQFSRESSLSMDKLAKLRQEELARFENELEEKVRLQAALQNYENKLKLQSNEMSQLQNRLEAQQLKVKQLEEELSTMISQKNLIETEKSRCELALDRNRRNHKEHLSKIERLAKMKINSFRNEYETLKKILKHDLELGDKDLKDISEDMSRVLNQKIATIIEEVNQKHAKMTETLKAEFQTKLKKLEKTQNAENANQKESYEKSLEIYKAQLEQDKVDLSSVRAENQKLKDELLSAREELTKLKAEIELLEADNMVQKNLYNEKSRDFEKLQRSAQEEIKRLKEETELLLLNYIKETDEQHSIELEEVCKKVETFQSTNLFQLRSIQEEINQNEKVTECELGSLKKSIQTQIDEYVKKIIRLEEDYSRISKERECFGNELQLTILKCNDLSETIEKLKEEVHQKTQTLSEVLNNQNKVHVQLQSEKERYNDEFAKIQVVVQEKNRRIEDLEKERDAIQSELIKVKLEAERLENAHKTRQIEAEKINKARNRELLDLKHLLAKSIKSFNQSMDTNLIIANNFGRETEELMQNIKREKPNITPTDSDSSF